MIKGNLIEKCRECDFCIFEQILTPEQRNRNVLNNPIPEKHVHRLMIEEICGQDYDDVCEMKYVAMRSELGDYEAAQWGAIKEYVWDLGKQLKKHVDYNEGWMSWTKKRDFGQKHEESYASRFREIWDLGVRSGNGNGKKQILTELQIYEIVVAELGTYEHTLAVLKSLRKESAQRDRV